MQLATLSENFYELNYELLIYWLLSTTLNSEIIWSSFPTLCIDYVQSRVQVLAVYVGLFMCAHVNVCDYYAD